MTPSLLIKNGYLPPGFAEKNVFGQGYVTGVVKSSGKSKTPLQALTCSVSGDPLSEKGMRAIAAQLPGLGLGGYVDNNHIATGAYGGWTSRPRDFGVDCRYGHIAIALSSEVLGSALQESDRLYRFEVKQRPELNRMHTAIDMGENNLNNAGTVNAKKGNYSEDIHAGGDINSHGGWLVTQHGKGWLNEAHGGGFYMDDNDWIRAFNNKGIYTGGRLATGEFLQLNGTAQAGLGCNPDGLVGRTPEGALLSCQSGFWKGVGIGEVVFSQAVREWQSLNIGRHAFCALARASYDYNNYRSCQIVRNGDGSWQLTGSHVGNGEAVCQAVCF